MGSAVWVTVVVGRFVAVEMGSDWVVGCCGGSGLLIRPWVAVDVVGRLVAVGMGRCGCVGGGVRRSEWLVFRHISVYTIWAHNRGSTDTFSQVETSILLTHKAQG